MENKGLVFIPDISGFTRFVNEIEIDHSRLIIQELLEVLMSANKSGLEVSEIEGDAILFYRFGEPPRLDDVYGQVEEMFCAFHQHLFSYDHTRYCFCKACTAAINLTLKVISHYGEFTGYRVRNFNKLIGRDIIVAHQLLKNDIASHEYWLVTNSLMPKPESAALKDGMLWNSSSKITDTGEIRFYYTPLTPLKANVNTELPEKQSLEGYKKVISVSQDVDRSLITLFHAAGDFANRPYWFDGVKETRQVSHSLPRIGMKCRIVTDKGESTLYSGNYRYNDEHIEFVEHEENNNVLMKYELTYLTSNRSRCTLHLYIRDTFTNSLLFGISKKAEMQHKLQKSLQNLSEYLKTFELDVSQTQVQV